MLRGMQRVRRQPHARMEFTSFVPTARHPPNLAHLEEVISEGLRSEAALWASRRQYEWVRERAEKHPRLLDTRTFFCAQRGISVPWWAMAKLAPTPSPGPCTLQWGSDQIQAHYAKGRFHVKEAVYALQGVDTIIGNSQKRYMEITRAAARGLRPVFVGEGARDSACVVYLVSL